MSDPVYGKDAHIAFGASLYALGSEWEFTEEADAQQEGTFGSGGYKKTWLGQKQLNGSVTMKLDRDMPPEVKAPVSDTQIELRLYEDYKNHPTESWTVPAKIVSYRVGPVNARTGLPTEVTLNWQSDGEYTPPTR